MDNDTVVTPPMVAGPLRLSPFRALRLRPTRIGDPASARLYARPFRKVDERIKVWTDRGDLIPDRGPALYLHEYTDAGTTIRGVVGALDLTRQVTVCGTDDGPSQGGGERAVVLPHEGIHPAQVDVLANRLDQMQLHPAPILLTHRASDTVRGILKNVQAEPPTWSFDDRGHQRHRIWPIRDAATIESLNEAWAESTAMIADGHHRYAAYLASRDRHPGTATDHGLAMLVDHGETPFVLGAIHRSLQGISLDRVENAADRIGWTPRPSDRRAASTLAPDTVVVTDGKRWVSLHLPIGPTDTAVELVHRDLLGRLGRRPQRVGYHHKLEDAIGRLRAGRDTAVILPAPEYEHIWAAVTRGQLLPEKATSFQPKPHAGVFIRSLRDE